MQYLFCKVRAACRIAAAGLDADLRVPGDDRMPFGRMTIRRPPELPIIRSDSCRNPPDSRRTAADVAAMQCTALIRPGCSLPPQRRLHRIMCQCRCSIRRASSTES